MKVQTVQDLINLKTNDNQPSAAPQITGDFGKDGVSLSSHWRLTDPQFAVFATASSAYSLAAISACAGVALSQAQTLPVEQARMTGQSLGLLTALFASLKNLNDPEAMFILNTLANETDKFLTQRKA